MEIIDRAGEWLAARTDFLPAPFDRLVILPILVIGLYVLAGLALRQVIPWVLRRLVAPVVMVLVGLLSVAALTVEFLFTKVFRLLRRRPAVALYAWGDATVTSMITLQGRVRVARRSTRRMGRIPSVVVLIAVGALVAWWNDGWCDRHPGAGDCRPPVIAWVEQARQLGGSTG